MVYSCAYWIGSDPGYGLAEAQRDKLDLICRKLELRPGMRLLDVGCGWGSLALHAAREYGVDVVGITLSNEQAEHARKQVVEAGLSEQVDIRVQDYRDLDDSPFDAISSIGMAEHVGAGPCGEYAGTLLGQLKPGGRLLNHQIVRRSRKGVVPGAASSTRTSFPTASCCRSARRRRDRGRRFRGPRRREPPRALRAHAAQPGSPTSKPGGTVRWPRRRGSRPGMAALHGRVGAVVRAGRIGVAQVLAVRRHADGTSGFPNTRTE